MSTFIDKKTKCEDMIDLGSKSGQTSLDKLRAKETDLRSKKFEDKSNPRDGDENKEAAIDKDDHIPKYTKAAPLLGIIMRWNLMGFKIAATSFFVYFAMNFMMPLITWQRYSGEIPDFMLNPYMIILTWLMYMAFTVYGYTFTYPRGTTVMRNVGKKGKMLIKVWYYISLISNGYTLWICIHCRDQRNEPDLTYALNYW